MLNGRRVAAAGLALATAYALPAAVTFGSRGAVTLGAASMLTDERAAAGEVALTFDDGPQRGVTERYLDLLAERGHHATFFVVGEQAARCPDIIERMMLDGHAVQSHGTYHRDHMLRPPWHIRRDMDLGSELIAAITGEAPTLFRPPHGVVTAATLAAARSLDQRVVLWSRWARDWEQRATAASITQRVLRELGAGEIILLHDADHYSRRDWTATWEALPGILDGLDAAGLTSCALHSPSMLT